MPAPAPTPIEDHGLIGDLRTAALVAKSGSIDFLCAPAFDSPSVFAALLDPAAGCFRIAPEGDGLRTTQMYLPDTNVLLTRFLCSEGIAELTDFMPVDGERDPQRVHRSIRVIRGRFQVAMLCAPRFDYGRSGHALDASTFRPARNGPVLRLTATVPLERQGDDLAARFTLEAGQSACFLLEIDPPPDAPAFTEAHAKSAFEATVTWWRHWAGQSQYEGRWREMVTRSALTLKLLTSRRHGAPVAAPTFGLPETPGGERNWDYRYVWIRDASFAMYAFIRLGLTQEAEDFVDWIGARVRGSQGGGALRVAYSLDGENDLPEVDLAMAGYAGSRPVRVGNLASRQFQLDIYGELMDAVYLANKYGRASSYEDWTRIRRMVSWMGENWRRPDAGIWEGRGEQQHFLHSRLMCWVAVDRAIRLAQKRSFPAPFPAWNQLRLEIHESIHEEYWRADLGSFVQFPGAETPDGAMLLMPLVRFISPRDPRWLGTLEFIRTHLVEDALVFRRAPADRALDGLPGTEGSFLACSFWFVECLARAGEVTEARLLFEKLLGYASPLGLFAEELSPAGLHQGNYPQALTHLALISAASYVNRALKSETPRAWS